jgi:hypothetical protein
VREWNGSENWMIISGVSGLMNIFGDISLFGSVTIAADPLLPADNWSVRYNLLVYRILKFDEKTTT